MQIFISIVGILLTIFFVIGTHEAAHFMVARWLGVKVLRFSIGFGKALYRWHDKQGTEYVLALIPLGGYVKMLDESEGNVSEQEKPFAFNRQPFYKKFLIVLAGPLMNMVCALVLYWLIFVIGFVTIKPIIGDIEANSIAAKSGLKAKQEIIAVDHQATPGWSNILFRMLAHTGEGDQLIIETSSNHGQPAKVHVLDLTHWHMDELKPDPFASLGITPYEPNIPLIIGAIAPQSPATSSGLQIGDKIIAVDKTPIKDWRELTAKVSANPSSTLSFSVIRNGIPLIIPVNIGYQRNLFLQKSGWLGIGPDFKFPKDLLKEVKYSPLAAIPYAWQEVVDFTRLNFVLFGKMLTGKLSLKSLGGPITIFETAGNALNSGLIAFLGFLAFLSISIGAINFLPIPGLDGGHLFIQLIEAIFRRPIPDKYLDVMFRFGFIFLIFILIQALINDVLRL